MEDLKTVFGLTYKQTLDRLEREIWELYAIYKYAKTIDLKSKILEKIGFKLTAHYLITKQFINSAKVFFNGDGY